MSVLQTEMQVEERRFWHRIDWNFALVIFALNLIGLINLYSATHGVHDNQTDRLFLQQIAWIIVGWGLYLLLTLVDYRVFFRMAYPLYAINLGALVAVELFGKVSYGAQRWLDLGVFRYQPSETMKITLVIVLSRWLASLEVRDGLGFKELVVPATLMGVPFFLIVKQPDLGTALIIGAIFASILTFVRVRRNILITAMSAGIIAAPLIWSFGLKEYQKDRVLNFLSPGRDPRGTGYNSIQSKIAIGSGKILGKGFRKGTQSQLEFLPERHTDFIFSVLSEEHGFVGSITTMGLFIVLLVMGLKAASHAREKFGALLAVGVCAYLFWHVSVNMAMVVGLLPIVGVPLPLLSYGGSSQITTMTALGLISAVSYRRYLF